MPTESTTLCPKCGGQLLFIDYDGERFCVDCGYDPNFFEEDEDPAAIAAAFLAGEKGVTAEINDLDFSQFHDLMHPIGTKYCRTQYGGPIYHAKLWWQYKCRFRPDDLWHRWILCRLGRHDIRGGDTVTVMGRQITTHRNCVWCYCDPPPQEE